MFEKLPPVPKSQDLIDKAFRRASIYAQSDESAVMVAGNILADNLANLIRKFPSLENLPPFYREIVEIIIGIDAMRIKLSRLRWASRQIREITKISLRNMKHSVDCAFLKKAAFGRMSSVIKSIDKDLEFLREAREKLRWIPTLDPDLPTILVAGFPNVGFVQPGQEVVLRYDAFPFKRFGQYKGAVERVSRTVWSPGEKVGPLLVKEPVYRVDVKLDSAGRRRRRPEAAAALRDDGQRRILQEKRKVWEWVFEPVLSLKQRMQ